MAKIRDDAASKKLTGDRVRAAREMTGLTQKDVAKHLGFANSARLNKIENGNFTRIELPCIIALSRLFQVSSDFLLGLTEECEPYVDKTVLDWKKTDGGKRQAIALIQAAATQAFQESLSEYAALGEQVRTCLSSLSDISEAFDLLERGVGKAMETERGRKKIESLPGGASILSALDKMRIGVRIAKIGVARCNLGKAIKEEQKINLEEELERMAEALAKMPSYRFRIERKEIAKRLHVPLSAVDAMRKFAIEKAVRDSQFELFV